MCLLSRLLVFLGILFIVELSVFVNNGLIKVLPLFVGKSRQLIHGGLIFSYVAFFIVAEGRR